MAHKPVKITDHAVVRYFERCLGIDMADVKEQILPASIHASVRDMGDNAQVPIANDCYSVLRDGRVVTVQYGVDVRHRAKGNVDPWGDGDDDDGKVMPPS